MSPKDPGQYDLVKLLNSGIFFLKKGNYDRAIKKFERAAKIDPSIAGVWMNLGIGYRGKKMYPKAIECFERALSLDRKLERLHLNLGIVQIQDGRKSEGIKNLERAIKQAPDDIESRMMLASALLDVGEQKKAHKVLRTARKKWSSEPAIIMMQANLWREEGKVDDAREAYQAVEDLIPGSGLSGLGQIALDQKQFGEADKYFSKLLKQKPRESKGWYGLALANKGLGRFDKSLKSFEKAIKFGEPSGALLLTYGDLLLKMGKPANAARTFRQLGKKIPDMLEIKLMEGEAWLAATKIRSAEKVLKDILASHPSDPALVIRTGMLCINLGDLDQAESLFSSVIETPETKPFAILGLGLAKLRKGEFKTAESHFEEVLELEPNTVQAILGLSQVQLIQGRSTEAIEGLRKAITLRPNDPTIAYDLLKGLVTTNQNEDAITLLREHTTLKSYVELLEERDEAINGILEKA